MYSKQLDITEFKIRDKVFIGNSYMKSYETSIIAPMFGGESHPYEAPYEIDECKIEEGDVIVDAGANIGMFSIFVSDKGKVYAFEPVGLTRELLKINVYRNKANVEILGYALGDENKDIEISVRDAQLGASTISGHDHSIDKTTWVLQGRKEKVKQVTLDSLNFKKVDFIKADIEGYEESFIRGAQKTIKKFKPKISICTYHKKKDPERLESLIKKIEPSYNIVQKKSKLYAY